MDSSFHLALLIAVALLSSSCGGAPPPRPPGPSTSDVNGVDGGATADGGDAPGDDGTDQGMADGAGVDGGDGDAGGDGGDGPTLAERLAACGGVDPANPAAELVKASFVGMPLVMSGSYPVLGIPFPYTSTLAVKVQLTSSLERSVATAAVSATVEPTVAQSYGDDAAKKRSGTVTTEMLSLAERATLGVGAPMWDDVVCTVDAAKRVTNATSTGTSAVSFAPALPSSVQTFADAERFAAELGTSRLFTGITATVEQSAAAAAPVGSQHLGSVTIRAIEPTYEAKLDDGSTVVIGGDAAFEVAINFGSPALTAALGLKPSTKFYIDHTQRAYKAIVIDSGEADTPPLVLVVQ